MKTKKLSHITAALLIGGLMVSGVLASDATISSSFPKVTFEDTDEAPTTGEWYIYSNNGDQPYKDYFGIFDKLYNNDAIKLYNSSSDVHALWRSSDGTVSVSDNAISIVDSADKSNSLVVNSSGDVNLANGSVFIDRSTKRMGIGTTAPRGALDIQSDGNVYLTVSGIDYRLNPGGDGLWFYNNANNPALIIKKNAARDTLVVGSNTSGKEGSVGIGTHYPQEKLDVLAKEDGARLVLSTIGDGTYDAPQFTSRRAGSDGSGNPENTKNLDVMGSFAWRGYDGSGWTGAKALFWVRADGDWSSSSTGTSIEIRQTPKNSTTALVALQIKNHADVYIPNGNLYVKGSKMNVPDYVFDKDYKLMPLAELEKYISTNSHLPGVQSAEEVGKEGMVNLSGLQMTLLEKVEELTLYTIQQEKALAQKEQQIKLMEEKINKLETMQARLSKVESLLTNLALDTSCKQSEKVSLNMK